MYAMFPEHVLPSVSCVEQQYIEVFKATLEIAGETSVFKAPYGYTGRAVTGKNWLCLTAEGTHTILPGDLSFSEAAKIADNEAEWSIRALWLVEVDGLTVEKE